MALSKVLSALECLNFRIHPNLRGDANVRLVLPLGGEIGYITVADLRRIQETLRDMRETREKSGAFKWSDGEGTCEYPSDAETPKSES